MRVEVGRHGHPAPLGFGDEAFAESASDESDGRWAFEASADEAARAAPFTDPWLPDRSARGEPIPGTHDSGRDIEPDLDVQPRAKVARSATGRRLLAAAAHDRLPPVLQSARWSLDGRALVAVGLLGALAVTIAVLLLSRSPRSEAVVTPSFTAATSAPATALASTAPTTSPTSTGGAIVVVDVAGLVVHPGVYELPAGARVIDALNAAGGPVDGTDLSSLNLARVLSDGEQVAVGVSPAPAAPGGPTDGSASGTGATSPLDLNLATESELDALPGVGPVLAARIVLWREQNGRFSSVDELLEVSGIGESTLADIAPLVRV